MADKTPEQVVDEALKRARTNRKQPDPPLKNNGLSADEQIEEGLIRARRKLSGTRDKLIDNLAKKDDPIDYALERKVIAKKLGVPSSAVDDAVKLRREEAKARPLYGYWNVDPWPGPEPVDTGTLLRDLTQHIQRYVIINPEFLLATVLWLMMSWVHEAIATHSPILNVNSPEPESGKTTLLKVIAFLMPRCITTVEVSEAALYRAIDRWNPSFVIDEFDSVLADKERASMRSVINSGHTRGDGVLKCEKEGDNQVPKIFPTFAPKAIGMIGRRLPASMITRSIFIDMRRRKKSETVERFSFQSETVEQAILRQKLARWAQDNIEALRNTEPSMPDELVNRGSDNWRLQFAIADLADEGSGRAARAAALKIEAGSDKRTASARTLAAIRTTLEKYNVDVIGSKRLIEEMCLDADSEWNEWRAGKQISEKQLANLLKPYGISPGQVRPDGPDGPQIRGYQRSWFVDAWERYLS